MAASSSGVDALERNLVDCQQRRQQADAALTQLLAQALQQLCSQSAEATSLRGMLDAMRAVNVKLAAQIKGFEKAEARVKELEGYWRRERGSMRCWLRCKQ
ncbi:hypothetical protein CLOP_g24513 [Closterium sp. NIES-67]|nr:hypothetical protein CLOP_g24513 [Closterium sp. NIES-67]